MSYKFQLIVNCERRKRSKNKEKSIKMLYK